MVDARLERRVIRARTPIAFTARVSGASMVPSLRDGDVVLAVAARRPRAGDVVLARFRSMPDRVVVKRVVARRDHGWWLASDNPFAGGDSGTHGVADVFGRVVLRFEAGRWWRPRRASPRRISDA